jgi:CheY-like chemotaxis protein
MSENKFKIFVVDDDPVAQMIITDRLNDPAYEVHTFDSGDDCLSSSDQEPDLILMDIEMPGMDGIQTCYKIREDWNSHIQILFISRHDDLETRLTAFDAGGNDFIVKPSAPNELDDLAQKIRIAHRYIQQQRGLSEQANCAQQAAMSAVSLMSEQGIVIEYLRNSFACKTPADLGQAILNALAEYGLQGIVEVRAGSRGSEYLSSKGPASPLEISIVGHARKMDKIFHFSDRMALNFPNVTLLVVHLPTDDEDLIGRLRDHLALIMEGAEARLDAMLKNDGIALAVSSLSKTIEQIGQGQTSARTEVRQLIFQLQTDIERSLVNLGLTEAQEYSVAEVARQASDHFNSILDNDVSLSDQLRGIVDIFQKLTSSHAK